MWKILCFIFVCHLTLFVSAKKVYYSEGVKVTDFKVEPNNGIYDYDAGEETIKPLISDNGGKTPFYYNYKFKSASGIKSTGTEILCDIFEDRTPEEEQRLKIAIMYALGGRRQCPTKKGETFYLKNNFSYGFYHEADGNPVNCGKNTADVKITGTTKTGKAISFKLEFQLTGGTCKSN